MTTYLEQNGKIHIQNPSTPFRFLALCGRMVHGEVYPDRVEQAIKAEGECATCKRLATRASKAHR